LNQSVEETWQKKFIIGEFFWDGGRKTGTFDIILFFSEKKISQQMAKFHHQKEKKKKRKKNVVRTMVKIPKSI
jgi:hypothetical protein